MYVAAIFVIGLIIGAVAYSLARPSIIKEDNQTTTSDSQDLSVTATTTDQQLNQQKRVGTDINKKLTYQQAIEMFEGHRIQFDNCFTLQTSMTFKGGTQIMLDNRSPDPQEIRLDGVVHRLWGYEFKILTLRRYSGLHTIKIDCQVNDIMAYNVAQILVQP